MSWNMVVALALVAAGVWAAWLRVKRRRAGQAMAGWQRVQGMVLDHAIAESVSTDSHGDRTDHFDPQLTYEYLGAGEKRTGTRASLDAVSFTSRQKAQAWLDARPVGQPIDVHVNPADPNDAVLDVAVKSDWWVPAFFVALGVAVAAGLFGS